MGRARERERNVGRWQRDGVVYAGWLPMMVLVLMVVWGVLSVQQEGGVPMFMDLQPLTLREPKEAAAMG